VHTAYGEPKADTELAYTHGDVQPAPFGVPYDDRQPDRSKKCRANNDTCNGWRMSASPYCPVHAGLMRNVKAEPALLEEVADEPPAGPQPEAAEGSG
jgi:hypothetical protein